MSPEEMLRQDKAEPEALRSGLLPEVGFDSGPAGKEAGLHKQNQKAEPAFPGFEFRPGEGQAIGKPVVRFVYSTRIFSLMRAPRFSITRKYIPGSVLETLKR